MRSTLGNLVSNRHLIEDGSEEDVKRYLENACTKVFVRSQLDNSMVHAYLFEVVYEEGKEPAVVIQIDGQRDFPNHHKFGELFEVEIYTKQSVISGTRSC